MNTYEEKTKFNPFRAPNPLSILPSSEFVPKKGFPFVKALRKKEKRDKEKTKKRKTTCQQG